MLALLVAPRFARSDEWEQVPSEPESGGAAEALAGNKGRLACTLVGAFVEETAKLRDKGMTEQSQLDNIDKPNGKLSRLTVGGMLSGDTSGTLRAGIHREIAYVYAHREMTPAQLGAHARQSCGNPARGAKGAADPPGDR